MEPELRRDAPREIRTPGQPFRQPRLYPPELRRGLGLVPGRDERVLVLPFHRFGTSVGDSGDLSILTQQDAITLIYEAIRLTDEPPMFVASTALICAGTNWPEMLGPASGIA